MSKNNLEVDKDKLELRMSRIIDAPREKVWKAHTEADAIEKWWGPRKYKTIVEKLEPKVGGQWRFVNEDGQGNRHVFFGEFLEMNEPEMITWTFTYEPYSQVVTTETVRFEELPDGKTKISTHSKFPSLEALEGMVQSGMEEGAVETWDRLEEYTRG